MSPARLKRRRLKTRDRPSRPLFGALCWRDGPTGVEICLVTSRKRGRWIVPKGRPVAKATPLDSARQEAWEEAGVRGVGHPQALGLYTTSTTHRAGARPNTVCLFEVAVTEIATDWPERRARRRQWLSP